MESQEVDWEPSKPLSFEQAGSILSSLGFLNENVTPQCPDFKLFQELWDLMEGTAREGVKQDDL